MTYRSVENAFSSFLSVFNYLLLAEVVQDEAAEGQLRVVCVRWRLQLQEQMELGGVVLGLRLLLSLSRRAWYN